MLAQASTHRAWKTALQNQALMLNTAYRCHNAEYGYAVPPSTFGSLLMVLLKLSRPYKWASRFKRDRRRDAGSCKNGEFAKALKLRTLNGGVRAWMFSEVY